MLTDSKRAQPYQNGNRLATLLMRMITNTRAAIVRQLREIQIKAEKLQTHVLPKI